MRKVPLSHMLSRAPRAASTGEALGYSSIATSAGTCGGHSASSYRRSNQKVWIRAMGKI
jgi:hypothetical protein